MPREARAILFDFGGTLDADGVPWGTRFFDAYRRAGGHLIAARFGELFRRSDAMLLGSHPPTGLGFRAMIEHQARILAELAPERSTELAGRMATDFHERALASVRRNRPMLERLARAHSLGVVSNFTGNLAECLDELELTALFSHVVDSTVAGVQKPDPSAFTGALSALGAAAESAWFVGDNPDCDVGPALELGMSACWLAPSERELPPGLRPTHRIASLLELEGLLS